MGGRKFGRATLSAVSSLNALSLEMIDLLDAQLASWQHDPSIVGVVLDAAGDKAFCAGGDVVALYRSIRATPPGKVPHGAADFFEREYRLDYRIHRYPKPILCWGHGITMGGGVGLLMGASHRVVTPQTRIAMPEISIGLFPDVGGSWALPRMPGRVGLFLALTGASLGAADARFVGLADFVLEHAWLHGVLSALGEVAWHDDRAANDAQLSHVLERFATYVDAATAPVRTHFDLINASVGNDSLAHAAVRLTELATHADPWLSRAARSFGAGSPTSATLGFELQRRARHLSLADSFRLEWQAAVACCMQHDFAEGVRALLIDKDKQPRWTPPTLAGVSPALVVEHLKPRPPGGIHPLADLH